MADRLHHAVRLAALLCAGLSVLAGCGAVAPAAQAHLARKARYGARVGALGPAPDAIPAWSHPAVSRPSLSTGSLPAVRTLTALDFLSAAVGFAAGETCPSTPHCTGFVLATGNSGEHWQALSPVPEALTGVLFRTPQLGFAWGQDGLYETADGGRTWTLRLQGMIGFVSFSGQSGWAGVNGLNCATQGCPFQIDATADGGETWHALAADALPDPYPGGGSSAALPWAEYGGGGFLGGGTGFVWTTVPAAGFQRTTDGGKTWHGTLGLSSPAISVSVLPSGAGWALIYPQAGTSAPAGVFQTTDGGATWQREGAPPAPWSEAVTALDGTLWLLTHQTGADAYGVAAPWRARSGIGVAPNVLHFTALDPVASAVAFAVASGPQGSYIMHTTDGGVLWNRVLSLQTPPTPGPDFGFWSAQDGFGFGGGVNASLLLATRDGGSTWAILRSLPQGLAGTGSFSNALDGWLIDQNGDPWVTRDGGQRWQRIATPVSGLGEVLISLGFCDAAHGYAIAGSGPAQSLYLTSDGGVNWRLAFSSAVAVSFSTRQDGWLLSGGDPQTLYRTTDGGVTWQAVLRDVPENFSSLSSPPGAPAAVWLWDSTDGRLAVSLDGAKTFSEVAMPAADLATLQSAPVPTAPATGLVEMGGALWRTTDAGAVWTAIARTSTAP